MKKYCYKCKERKDIKEFSKNSTRRDGLNSQCRDCSSTYQRKWYKGRKIIHKNNVMIRKRKEIKRNKISLMKYLKQHPCIDCGNSDVRVLEFDHVRGIKKYNIAMMVGSCYAWKTIEEEIGKCEVVCANCHRIRTSKKFKWKYRIN